MARNLLFKSRLLTHSQSEPKLPRHSQVIINDALKIVIQINPST
jgi:hypothetical protein